MGGDPCATANKKFDALYDRQNNKARACSTATYYGPPSSSSLLPHVGRAGPFLFPTPTPQPRLSVLNPLKTLALLSPLLTQGTSENLLVRMGGPPALKAVIDGFYSRLEVSDRTKHFFVGQNMQDQRRRQVRRITKGWAQDYGEGMTKGGGGGPMTKGKVTSGAGRCADD